MIITKIISVWVKKVTRRLDVPGSHFVEDLFFFSSPFEQGSTPLVSGLVLPPLFGRRIVTILFLAGSNSSSFGQGHAIFLQNFVMYWFSAWIIWSGESSHYGDRYGIISTFYSSDSGRIDIEMSSFLFTKNRNKIDCLVTQFLFMILYVKYKLFTNKVVF